MVPVEMFMPGNNQEISAHITPFFSEHKELIHQAYFRGPAVSSGGEPVFLSWQPALGYEEARLWNKGTNWALAMGLLWLPIIGCIVLCTRD